MRPEPNNDIDLLLRQLSRRNGAPVSEIDEQHLDADELNSYVANALPVATRARYTAHLADCSSCRKLVVDLSAAQGPVTVRQSGPAVAPSGLMSFLASLFSPMVLRYAVPALGLMVIAVIGVVVLRKDGRNAPIAQNESPQPAVTSVPQESPSSGFHAYDSASRGKTDEAKQQPAAQPANQEVAKVAPVTKEARPAANVQGDTAGAVAAEPPPAPKAVPAEEDTARIAKLQDEQKKAEAPQPAAARDANKERGADKNEPAKQKTDNIATVTVAPNTTSRKDIAVRPAKSAETADAGAGAGQDLKRSPTGKVQTQSRAEARAEGRGADADDKAVETRSVAGRRFRKSGRVWIDTAFDSSKPIISVARGSEHYRSLVGDEPSLRKIADELDGEIVVVWKGSTYRIR